MEVKGTRWKRFSVTWEVWDQEKHSPLSCTFLCAHKKMPVLLFRKAGPLLPMGGDKCCLSPGDFTGKQEAQVSRPLTVISADLAKLTIDVFWGGGEMLWREKLKCPREVLSFNNLYLSLKDCSEKLSSVLYAVFCSSMVF